MGALFSVICSLTVTAVLARILGPGPFGEVIIASTIYGFVNLFVNGGFSQALVHRADLPVLQIRRAFTTQMLLSLLLTAVVVACAPFIARQFRTPSAAPVIRAMALIIMLQAFGLVSAALLKRDLRFNVVQQANITAYVVGYMVVGLPLAIHSRGVWSLVAAYLSQAFITSAYLYVAVRHSITPSFHLPDRDVLTFGGAVVGSNMVNWGHSNLDNLASSRLGPASLGLYGRACNLLYQPVTSLVTTLQPVLLSASARMRSRPETIGRMLLAVLALACGILLPAYTTLALIPDTVIIGLYGPKWMSSVPLILPMALAMPLWGAMALCGPVLSGIGKPHREFWSQASTCLVGAIGFFTASRYSLTAIAWMLLITCATRLLVIAKVTSQALQITYSDVAVTICGRLPVATLFGLSVFACNRTARLWTVSESARLGLDAALACILMASLVWFFPRIAFGNYAVNFLCDYASHLPAWYRPRLMAVKNRPSEAARVAW